MPVWGLNWTCCAVSLPSVNSSGTPLYTAPYPSPGLPCWQHRPGKQQKLNCLWSWQTKACVSVSALWIYKDLIRDPWPPAVCVQTDTQLAEAVPCYALQAPLLGCGVTNTTSPPPVCQTNLYYYSGTDHTQWLVPYQQSSTHERMKIRLTSVDAWL